VTVIRAVAIVRQIGEMRMLVETDGETDRGTGGIDMATESGPPIGDDAGVENIETGETILMIGLGSAMGTLLTRGPVVEATPIQGNCQTKPKL
jgi:hypothetical protein